MRTLRWILGIAAVLFVLAILAIAAAGVWLNTYIHSEAFKVEVETRAARTLGGTVQVQTVDFDILHGVKLQGFVTQIDASHTNAQGALQAKIENVNLTYDWTELLKRRLRLTGVTLDKPQIVLTKQQTTPAPSQPKAGGLDSGAAQGPGTALPFQFVLDRAKIKDGAVSIRDAAGASVIDLQGVNADANTAGYYEGKDVTGTFRVAAAALPSNFHVTDFSTPFSYRQGAFEATPFEATGYSGRFAGGYKLGATGPSILDLNGKGIDIAKFTEATSSRSTAKLSGTLDVQSKWHSVEAGEADGEGDAQLTNGKLAGVKGLHDLAKLLKINELDAPDITKAQTHFLVANRQTKFIGLQIDSPIYRITGDGVIGFDGAVQASLVLILTRDSMDRIPKEAAASFVQQQDGTGSIAFHVTGTTADPQTDLAMRLLLQNTKIQNVLNKALNSFFHKPNKNQNPAPEPAPAPPPAPNPDANLAPPPEAAPTNAAPRQ